MEFVIRNTRNGDGWSEVFTIVIYVIVCDVGIELGLTHVFETLTLVSEVLNWLESPNCHYDPKFHIQNADAM